MIDWLVGWALSRCIDTKREVKSRTKSSKRKMLAQNRRLKWHPKYFFSPKWIYGWNIKKTKAVGGWVCAQAKQKEEKSKVYIKYWFDEKLSIKMLNKIIINDFTSVQTTSFRGVFSEYSNKIDLCTKKDSKQNGKKCSQPTPTREKEKQVERKSGKESFCFCREHKFQCDLRQTNDSLSHCLVWPPPAHKSPNEK